MTTKADKPFHNALHSTSWGLKNRFIVWTDKKFNDHEQYIEFLFDQIDQWNIFKYGKDIIIKPIQYDKYKQRYHNGDDLTEIVNDLQDDVMILHDWYDFGLTPTELLLDCGQLIEYSDNLIHELHRRNDRHKDRRLNDMLNQVDEHINGIRDILAKHLPLLNNLRRINNRIRSQSLSNP